ncbi:5-oxoprolinase subunit C family protein [Aquimarina sp. M1]
MMSGVEIISSGLYTSIQDRGRFGFSKFGVPRSGAMDLDSFFLANALLNNYQNGAVIEWTIIPPVLKFHKETSIVVTGVLCIPYLNDKACKMNAQLRVCSGNVLKFKNIKKGVYGYVGIKHGFMSENKLNSRSQYSMVTKSDKLQKGDVVSYKNSIDFSTSHTIVKPTFFWSRSSKINAFQGPEFNLLSVDQREVLLQNDFTIASSRNRMAIPLKESLQNDLHSMLTAPVLPGTVQLTPSGQLIILMRDCQTTGGYPRVLQLTEEAINKLAQKRAGEKIRLVIKSF